MSARIEAFRKSLHDLGHVEGKNIVIEYRYADGKSDSLSAFAAELVRAKVDVIVTAGASATGPAKEATTTIRIVTAQDGDPVTTGAVASLARPGGNVTGLSSLTPPAERATEPPTDHPPAQGETPRMSWARVFDIDIEHCPNCGGALNRKFQLSLRQLTRSLVKRYISG